MGEVDIERQMMIRQGYVSSKCTLNGKVIWGLMNRSEDPCGGCNESRNICDGRPPDKDYKAKARILIDLENAELAKRGK